MSTHPYRRRTLIALGAALTLTGCPEPETPCADVQGTTALAIGTGSPNAPLAYLAIQPGQSVQLTPGSQGGQHIWLQLQATGICPAHPRVRIRIVRVSDETVVGTSQFTGTAWQPAPGGPSGTYVSAPYRGVIEQEQYCTIVNGGEVRVEASIDDTAMHLTDASVNVTVRGWSADALPADRAAREACCADFNNRVCWPNGAPDAAVDAAMDASEDATIDVADEAATDAAADATIDAMMDEAADATGE